MKVLTCGMLPPGLAAHKRGNKHMSYQSLSHSKWACKYHLVFIPKCGRKKLSGKIRDYLGPIFHELANQRNCRIVEGHMVQDHVHMLIEIPPNQVNLTLSALMPIFSTIILAASKQGNSRIF